MLVLPEREREEKEGTRRRRRKKRRKKSKYNLWPLHNIMLLRQNANLKSFSPVSAFEHGSLTV